MQRQINTLHKSSRRGDFRETEQEQPLKNQENPGRAYHGSQGETQEKGESKPSNAARIKEKEKVH